MRNFKSYWCVLATIFKCLFINPKKNHLDVWEQSCTENARDTGEKLTICFKNTNKIHEFDDYASSANIICFEFMDRDM